MSSESSLIHLVAGALGGTAGAVLTCPLEVVKTRLQSSIACHPGHFSYASPTPAITGEFLACKTFNRGFGGASTTFALSSRSASVGVYQSMRNIVQAEGSSALFKGLLPNLIGVAPSRAIYFGTYSQCKRLLNDSDLLPPDSIGVHMVAAAFAGFTSATCTNPIWFIKTRLQLDQKTNGHGLMTTFRCARFIYSRHGLRGFYKGITASYYGLSETVLHFVVYEEIKALLRRRKDRGDDVDEKDIRDFLEYMGAGATSKTIATCLAYPHEVARTRLREEGDKYRRFWQTIILVAREEGLRGLYRGLSTQLMRQIPNTAIVLSTYEAVVHFAQKYS